MFPDNNTFMINIPPDPNWEPFQTTDVLDQDGYYCARITQESARSDTSKLRGVFITLELQDEDVRGKILSKFLPDPTATQKNTWFVWRGLIMSITGNKDQAKGGLQYVPGMFTGQIVYFRTEPYVDDGVQRTSVQTFVTRAEWEEAVKTGRHRWASRAPAPTVALGMPSALGAMPSVAFGAPATSPSGPAVSGQPGPQAGFQVPSWPPGAR